MKRRDKCKQCAWAFADWCLAYPVVLGSGRHRRPSYKVQSVVTEEECAKMRVKRIGGAMAGSIKMQQERVPRPRRIIRDEQSDAIDLW